MVTFFSNLLPEIWISTIQAVANITKRRSIIFIICATILFGSNMMDHNKFLEVPTPTTGEVSFLLYHQFGFL